MKISFSKVMMILGLVFLYIPIFILIIYSFNSSKIVTVWGGFSAKWYKEIFLDTILVSAVITTLKIATISATLSVIIGTLAGYCLIKFRFPGKILFSSLLPTPLIVPEVVTGLALLLFFVWLRKMTGWPESKGVTTVVIAHTTLGLSYVSMIVRSRLSEFDNSIYDAALDLGATPIKAFVLIVIPLIMPAIISSWLLVFTLSIDDLVLASFTSVPGVVTLPMLIYSRVRIGVSPEINVLATIIIIMVSILAFVAYFVLNNRKKTA